MLEFRRLVQPKPGAGDLAIGSSKLEFWQDWFDQSLERVTLPSPLQSLNFGARFNQSLERVTLPSGLQSLGFGRLVQPKPGAGDLAIESSKPKFWQLGSTKAWSG